ncbi:hypothetical protein BH09PLA1_BH09PLA1_17780 [soil metagenome]
MPNFTMEPLESLEPRKLLAGVTILAHGYQGSINGWVATVADNIALRAGGNASASEYVMSVGRNGQNQLAVLSYAREGGWSAPRDTDSAEIIVQLDWQSVSDGSFSTDEVAHVVSDWLIGADSDGVRLAELPLHLIGHSRGASLMTAVARDLGERGIWVDQQTNLDPHPIDGRDDPLGGVDFGDQSMVTFDNVAFADTYWRDDADARTFDGDDVAGSHNLNLNNSVQQEFFDAAHNEVPSYYDGTINFDAGNSGNSPIFDSWYGSDAGNPARDQTGFLYSRIVRGARPADGSWTQSNGTAQRTAAGEAGDQWANLTDIRVMGGRTFATGQGLTIRLLRQDREGRGNIALFLDPDTNPYNDNNARTLRRTNVREAEEIVGTRQRGATSGAPTGRYFVGARIVDSSGHVRYAYSKRIELVDAPAASGADHAARSIDPTIAMRTAAKSSDLSDELEFLA